MPPRSQLTETPPYAVESAIKALGANLRTARLRRNLTLADMAAKLGVSRFVVADAEKGKVTTNIAVYAGLLWAMNLLDQLSPVGDPAADKEGSALAAFEGRDRARHRKEMDNDF